jgi:hypothetical protein
MALYFLYGNFFHTNAGASTLVCFINHIRNVSSFKRDAKTKTYMALYFLYGKFFHTNAEASTLVSFINHLRNVSSFKLDSKTKTYVLNPLGVMNF